MNAGAELINDLFLPWHPSAGVRYPVARLARVRLILAGGYAKNRVAYPVKFQRTYRQPVKLQEAAASNKTKGTRSGAESGLQGLCQQNVETGTGRFKVAVATLQL